MEVSNPDQEGCEHIGHEGKPLGWDMNGFNASIWAAIQESPQCSTYAEEVVETVSNPSGLQLSVGLVGYTYSGNWVYLGVGPSLVATYPGESEIYTLVDVANLINLMASMGSYAFAWYAFIPTPLGAEVDSDARGFVYPMQHVSTDWDWQSAPYKGYPYVPITTSTWRVRDFAITSPWLTTRNPMHIQFTLGQTSRVHWEAPPQPIPAMV